MGKWITGPLLLGLLLSVAACGERESEPEPAPAPADASVAGVAGAVFNGGVAGAEVTAAELAVTLGEWLVSPARDSIPAGRVRLRVRNDGSMAHVLEVEGNDQEWETEPLEPGSSATLDVTLVPGTYALYCPIDSVGVNHEQMGMSTQLHVF